MAEGFSVVTGAVRVRDVGDAAHKRLGETGLGSECEVRKVTPIGGL